MIHHATTVKSNLLKYLKKGNSETDDEKYIHHLNVGGFWQSICHADKSMDTVIKI